MRQLRRQLNPLLAERNHACRQVKEEKECLTEAKQHTLDVQQAQKIVQELAEQIQHQVHARIAGVVTRCLKTVFEEDAPEFRISFVQRRGRTEADLRFVRNGNEYEPKGASGCGAIDVAAFALRLVALLLKKPAGRRLLIFDEPMRFLNGERYQERVAELIQSLADEFKVQFIIATDDEFLKLGKVVEL